MSKKIAVLVRVRQAEALRMAIGLSIQGDRVDVFIMGQELDVDDPAVALNLEMLAEIGVPVISHISHTFRDSVAVMSTEDIARKLVEYDSVIPY